MTRDGKLLIAIIGAATILGFAAPSDNINEAKVAEQVAVGVQSVEYATNDVAASIKEAELEAEKERLAELGYPEGYDPMNPIANGEFTEEDWAAIQQEDAMKSLAEDAMRDYYSEPPDISDEVLKP